jgi:cellulose synthase/poly-beta-1,6-N-acetylglucosamine synthase-like glycosyltransferase
MTKHSEYDWPFPYSAGHFGAGANFAVRRQTILDLGGFDEALGAGTRCGAGEDNEMFVRVLLAGYDLSYRPSAVVWHRHRREWHELRSLLLRYGMGLSATAVREFMAPNKWDMIRGQARGARNLFNDRQAERSEGLPFHLLAIEVAGILVGPFAYAIERWRGPHMG